ncbi:MAG TPA: hypothetical protein VJH21_01970 [Candidatus Paceibacterota bacterium]
MKHILNEVTLSILLIVLVLFFLDPFMLLMPDSLVYTLISFIFIVFMSFISLVWREDVYDERDSLHRMIAGRLGYLIGASVLIFAIIFQALFSHPSPWLIGALLGMIMGKLAGLYYSRMHF